MSDFQLFKDYIQELIGTPYVWWKEGDKVSSKEPFWAEDTQPPSSELVKKSGCNCAGFINLICRFSNIYIPGLKMKLEYAGGTYIWYTQLKNNGLLDDFTNDTIYPPGTLLLRNYFSESDQGHVAIVLDNGKLAHCYPDIGIAIDDSYFISHNWIESGYYSDVCLLKNWLFNPKFQK
jgi:cell wall-associated NlpC family hydrolase